MTDSHWGASDQVCSGADYKSSMTEGQQSQISSNRRGGHKFTETWPRPHAATSALAKACTGMWPIFSIRSGRHDSASEEISSSLRFKRANRNITLFRPAHCKQFSLPICWADQSGNQEWRHSLKILKLQPAAGVVVGCENCAYKYSTFEACRSTRNSSALPHLNSRSAKNDHISFTYQVGKRDWSAQWSSTTQLLFAHP